MSPKRKELVQKKETLQLAGGQTKVNKQHEAGKLTARERMQKLFDEGTFVELDVFVKHRCTNFGMQEMDAAAEGVITGYGKIDGRLVYAYAQDFTVLEGSLGEMNAGKILKVLKMAMKMGAPIVSMNDSSGARIQEGMDALFGYGQIFRQNMLASGVIPQISAIMGSCAGGAAYAPAMTDFVFMVNETSRMFCSGPQNIENTTGKKIDIKKLGGAMTHNSVSGVAHFISDDDEACIEDIRRLIRYLPSNNLEIAPVVESDDVNRIVEEFNQIIPSTMDDVYDMKGLIQMLADHGDFMEVQEHYAKNIVTGYMRLHGQTIGVVANQPEYLGGCLDIDASDKAARFVRTCDCFNIPLLTLVDVAGFYADSDQEFRGILRHGAKLLYAYSEATVPKVTLNIRKAYGGAYVVMCSKSLGADIVLAWPSAQMAVMDPQGAANILFKNEIREAEDPFLKREQKIDEYAKEFATPYKAAERGYVDDIIEPELTVIRLAEAFDMLASKSEQRPAKKHGNIPL